MVKILLFVVGLCFTNGVFAGNLFNGFSEDFINKLELKSEFESQITYSNHKEAPVGTVYTNPKDGKSYIRIDDMIFKTSGSSLFYSFEEGARRWPNGTLYYQFDNISRGNQQLFNNACNLWGKKANVRCEENRSASNYVLVGEYGGNFSSVGMTGGEQSLSIYNWDDDTIAHEVMHAFGFTHEQCRNDRDRYVTIEWDNIKDSMEYNFSKDGGSSSTEYDYYSVMHYDAWAFTSNGGQTIIPLDSSVDLRRMGRSSISDTDYQDMINAYGSNGINPGPVNPGPVNPGPVNPGPVDPGNPSPIDPGDPIPTEPGSLQIASWGDINSNNIVIQGNAASRKASTVTLLYDFGRNFDYIYTQSTIDVVPGRNFTISAPKISRSGYEIEFVIIHMEDSNGRLLDQAFQWVKNYPEPTINPTPGPTDPTDPTDPIDPGPVIFPDSNEPIVVSSWGNLSGNQISISGTINSPNASFISLYFDRSGEQMTPETFQWVNDGDTFNLTASNRGSLRAIYVILFDEQQNIIKKIKKVLN